MIKLHTIAAYVQLLVEDPKITITAISTKTGQGIGKYIFVFADRENVFFQVTT